MQQRVTVKYLAAENITEGESRELRLYDRSVRDVVKEEVFEGPILPNIHYTERASMVEILDLDGQTATFIFGVLDIRVERLDEGPLQAQVVATNK